MANSSTKSPKTRKSSKPYSLIQTEGQLKLLTSNNPFGRKEPPSRKPRTADFQTTQQLKWPKIYYRGGSRSLCPQWNSWVEKLRPVYGKQWEELEILDAIEASLLSFQLDKQLIDTLVGFWCGETSTFVTEWGEFGFTLEDAHMLGNMPLRGGRVSRELEGEEEEWYEKLIQERLRIYKWASKITLKSWLVQFQSLEDSMLEHIGFLAFFLQRMFLPNGPDNEMPTCVHGPAIRLALGQKLALAPAAVANLYAGLSSIEWYASTDDLEEERNAKKVFGPFWLLQLWAWERFPSISPVEIKLETSTSLRMLRWGARRKSSSLPEIIRRSEEFVWRPYVRPITNLRRPNWYPDEEEDRTLEMVDFVLMIRPNELVGFCNTKNTDVPLVPYKPYRVARQFGLDQGIPLEMHYTADMLKAWEKYIEETREAELYVPAQNRIGRPDTKYSKWMEKVLSSYPVQEVNRIEKEGDKEIALQTCKFVEGEELNKVSCKKARKDRTHCPKKGTEWKEKLKKGKIKVASLNLCVPETATQEGDNDRYRLSEEMQSTQDAMKADEDAVCKEQISLTETSSAQMMGEVKEEKQNKKKGFLNEEVGCKRKKRQKKEGQEVIKKKNVDLACGQRDADRKRSKRRRGEVERVIQVGIPDELDSWKKRRKKKKAKGMRDIEEVLLASEELRARKKSRKVQGAREIREVRVASEEPRTNKKSRKKKVQEVREIKEVILASEKPGPRKKDKKLREQEVREIKEVLLASEEPNAGMKSRKKKGQEGRSIEEVLLGGEGLSLMKKSRKMKMAEVRESEEVLLASVGLSEGKKRKKKEKEMSENTELIAMDASKVAGFAEEVKEMEEGLLTSEELGEKKKKSSKKKEREMTENNELIGREASKAAEFAGSSEEYPTPPCQGADVAGEVGEREELLLDFMRKHTQSRKRKGEGKRKDKKNGKQREMGWPQSCVVKKERAALHGSGATSCLERDPVEECTEETLTSNILGATFLVKNIKDNEITENKLGKNSRGSRQNRKMRNPMEMPGQVSRTPCENAGGTDSKGNDENLAPEEQLPDKLTVISHFMENDQQVAVDISHTSLRVAFEDRDESMERQQELARELIQLEKDGYLTEQDSESKEMDFELDNHVDIYGEKALKRYPKFFLRVPQHPTYPGFDFSSSGVGEFCATAFWMNFVPTIQGILKASRKNPYADVTALRQELAGVHRAGFNTEHIDSYLNELERLQSVLKDVKAKENSVLCALDGARSSHMADAEKLQSCEDEVRDLEAVVASLEEQLSIKKQKLEMKQDEITALRPAVTKSSVATIGALEEKHKILILQRESAQAEMEFLLQKSSS